MTLQDSIFPEVKMAGGVSSKATEYKELSRKIRPATNGRTNGHTNGSTNVHPNANVNIVNGKAPLSSTPLAAPLDVNAGNVHQTIGGR
ncbi:hypothetical protein J3459_016044 [Metarhizium acridum]|nr:hypothetical protein J3459_016044 [Metarhizium acridum]